MKKFRKIVAILSICICSCYLLAGCLLPNFDGSATVNDIEAIEQPNYNIELQKGLGYYITITGALKNISKRDYTYVSITFTIYDENGYNAGTAMDNMNYLKSGETWKYNAQSFQWFNEYPSNIKCTDITCI